MPYIPFQAVLCSARLAPEDRNTSSSCTRRNLRHATTTAAYRQPVTPKHTARKCRVRNLGHGPVTRPGRLPRHGDLPGKHGGQGTGEYARLGRASLRTESEWTTISTVRTGAGIHGYNSVGYAVSEARLWYAAPGQGKGKMVNLPTEPGSTSGGRS